MAPGSPGPAPLMEVAAALPAGSYYRSLLEAVGAEVATPGAGFDPAVLTVRLVTSGDGSRPDLAADIALDPQAPLPPDPIGARAMRPEAVLLDEAFAGPPENDDTPAHTLRPPRLAGYPTDDLAPLDRS